jgi:protein-histidine pros-kinase
MDLRTKFNLMTLAAFCVGFLVAAIVLDLVAAKTARHQVLENARIMMTAANGVREYTAQDLVPLLPIELGGKSFPKTSPRLRRRRPSRTYGRPSPATAIASPRSTRPT